MTHVTRRQLGPLNERERDVLDALVQLQGEYGLEKNFTGDAVALIAGPCAGSLAALTMKGYVTQRNAPEGIAYQVTEAGYALYAGIEGVV